MTMAGWKSRFSVPVGGLTEVGLSEDERFVLVVSHDGRGVFDTHTGVRLARDREIPESGAAWRNKPERLVLGIGPLTNVWVSVVGLCGGSLRARANDLCVLTRADSARQDVVLFSEATGEELLLDSPVTEIRALGFSSSGRFLVIATSSDLSLHAEGA
jgi:hypothetical protein